MAGGRSLSPLTGPAGSVQRAIAAGQLNAGAMLETPADGMRQGIPFRGAPSAAGTTRFAGDKIVAASVFERTDLGEVAGPSVEGFVASMQSGPFKLLVPGAPTTGGQGGRA